MHMHIYAGRICFLVSPTLRISVEFSLYCVQYAPNTLAGDQVGLGWLELGYLYIVYAFYVGLVCHSPLVVCFNWLYSCREVLRPCNTFRCLVR